LAPPFVRQRSPKWQLCRGPLITKFSKQNLRVFFLLFDRTPFSQPTILTCSCYNYCRFCHSFMYSPYVNQYCLISVDMNTPRIYVSPFFFTTLNICKTRVFHFQSQHFWSRLGLHSQRVGKYHFSSLPRCIQR
jgi:hypothetical protein